MTRRINRYNGSLAEFVRFWDIGLALPAGRAEIRRSAGGNLNRHGSCRDYSAECLTPRHPQFAASLEPAVAKLVQRLVYDWQLITYSSCAGHLHVQEMLPPTPRYVGILPRHAEEMIAVRSALQMLAATVQAQFVTRAITIHVAELALDAHDGSWPCLELRFDLQAQASWWTYFDHIEEVYQTFLAAMPLRLST